MDFADRAALLAEAPDVYYVTDHYVPHAAVLVRLAHVSPSVLRDLLGMSYKFVAGSAKSRAAVRRRNSRPKN